MSDGFYKRRRGILEHLEAGKVTLLDSGIHDYLCLRMNGVKGSSSNIPPGVVFTSSKAIKALCPREFSERTIRRSLAHLEKIGWIKRWMTPGNRGNYPILIARASVHDSSGTEYRINAEATTDWRDPVLISAAECPGSVHEVSTYRELRSKNREKTTAAKTAPPADPRFQEFFNFAYQSVEAKHGHAPLWAGKDRRGLQVLLREHMPATLPIERLKALWQNFATSTEPFTQKQGDSLAYFCSNLDKFSTGPLLADSMKGNGNGNYDPGEAQQREIERALTRRGDQRLVAFVRKSS